MNKEKIEIYSPDEYQDAAIKNIENCFWEYLDDWAIKYISYDGNNIPEIGLYFNVIIKHIVSNNEFNLYIKTFPHEYDGEDSCDNICVQFLRGEYAYVDMCPDEFWKYIAITLLKED